MTSRYPVFKAWDQDEYNFLARQMAAGMVDGGGAPERPE